MLATVAFIAGTGVVLAFNNGSSSSDECCAKGAETCCTTECESACTCDDECTPGDCDCSCTCCN